MDQSTGAIIGLGVAQLVALITVVLKMRGDREERVRLAALDVEKEERAARLEVEKETRHRQWQVEDRERLAREVVVASNKLADRVEVASTTLAATAAASHDAIVLKLDENTKISVDAFAESATSRKEANHLTEKIASLTGLFNREGNARNERITRLEDAAATPTTTGPPLDPEVLDRVDETTQATLREVKKK